MKNHILTSLCLVLSGSVSLQAGLILGTGTQFLIGHDLTDRTEVNGATLQGTVTASGMTIGTEGGANEHAHRVFDNAVDGSPPNPAHDQAKTKICCSGLGGSITYQFDNGPQVLRTYTLSSANDVPDRDPIEWQISGSNNGTDFTLLDHVTANTWTARHQVQIFNQFSEGANSTAYEYIRYSPITAAGAGDQHQITEIEYFDFNSTTTGMIIGGLLGNDLTDENNDGAPDADVGYDATFASDNNPGFGNRQLAFNIFDNQIGNGNEKWCCDDPSPGNPANGPGHQVDATLKNGKHAILTHFTIASSGDSPARDPRIWGIFGSTDGTNYEPIFFHAQETGSIFSARNQVVQFTAGVDFELQEKAYNSFRLSILDSDGGTQSALAELEYFGTVIPEPSAFALLLLGLAVVGKRVKNALA